MLRTIGGLACLPHLDAARDDVAIGWFATSLDIQMTIGLVIGIAAHSSSSGCLSC